MHLIKRYSVLNQPGNEFARWCIKYTTKLKLLTSALLCALVKQILQAQFVELGLLSALAYVEATWEKFSSLAQKHKHVEKQLGSYCVSLCMQKNFIPTVSLIKDQANIVRYTSNNPESIRGVCIGYVCDLFYWVSLRQGNGFPYWGAWTRKGCVSQSHGVRETLPKIKIRYKRIK